jgi:PAS domain S-box-containing protein
VTASTGTSHSALVVRAGLLAAVFALTAYLGIEISRHTNNVAAVWLPNGIALAVMLLAGRRDWPYFALAAAAGNIAVNILHGDNLAVTLGFTVCNLSEILLAYLLLQRFAVGAAILESPQALLKFLGISAVSAAVSAFPGAGLIATAFGADYWTVWHTWWVGDAVGLMMVTPLALSWLTAGAPRPARPPQLESAILSVGFVATTVTVFHGDLGNDALNHVLPLLTLPFQIWAALRFGARGATVTGAFVAAVGIASIVTASSPLLGIHDPVSAISSLQAILVATNLTALMLVAAFSERQRSEARIDAAEARLRDAIDNLGEGFAIFDGEDRLVMCNRTYRAIYQASPDMLAPGARFEDLLRRSIQRGIHPAAAEDPEAWIAEHLRLRRAAAAPFEQLLGDGRCYKITERRTAEGGTVGAWTDITEIKNQEKALRESETRLRERETSLRASESRYRRLMETIPDAVFTTRDGKIEYVNGAALGMFGASDKARLVGRPVLDLIHPDDHAIAAARLRTIGGGGATVPAREERGVRLDGGVFNMEMVAAALPETQDPELIAIVRDISDRRLTELQLREAQKMEAIGRLAGGVAHEFNNLLAVVVGNLDFALSEIDERDDDQRLNKVLSKALDAAERGSKLTSQLLAHSRKQSLLPQPVDPHSLITDMRDLLVPMLGPSIELRLKPRHGAWRAQVDPSQLESALINLALNARDAMPAGGVLTIETSCAKMDGVDQPRGGGARAGDFVLVTVGDTGTGMSSDIMERAFEPFFTTKDSGTGLGLSMVYGFAKQSGGHLRISSEIGRGTSVRLYLPRSSEAVAAAAAIPTEAPSTTTGDAATILVVEDNDDLRDLVVRQLSGLGYRVMSAEDGGRAMEILASDIDLDLLLTDVIMPGGMNGREVAEQSRRLRPWLRVLYMSGYSADALVRESKLDPDVALIKKPFQKQDLANRIR